MQLGNPLSIPGEHGLFLPGTVGSLEAVLSVPEDANLQYMAILGHPHSLQGGTMNNKVVTTLVRAFKTLAIPSIRFNFRGVGGSDGVYDAGVGEAIDMLAIADLCQNALPTVQFIFAGFSFGSYVAYRAAAHRAHALLMTIAPAIPNYDYQEFAPIPAPWVVFQGLEDEVISAEHVIQFARDTYPPLPLIEFPETGHFFHGKLMDLKGSLIKTIQTHIQ